LLLRFEAALLADLPAIGSGDFNNTPSAEPEHSTLPVLARVHDHRIGAQFTAHNGERIGETVGGKGS
jgi:hypothetical protein